MRLAFFADSYKPYISGVTVSIDSLAAELRDFGHRVYIVAPGYPGDKKDEDKDVIRMPSIPTKYSGFRLAVPYLYALPEVDLIHTHSPFQTGLLARYLAKKRRVPLVYTFHTLFTRYVHYAGFLPKRFAKLAIASYIREFCKRADLTIAPTNMSKRVLKKWGANGRCEVVPTGVDIAGIRIAVNNLPKAEARKRLGIPKDAEVMVYLGRISEEKNISFLFKAFQKLYAPNRYFLLVGGGPLLPKYRPQKLKNVVFAGEKEHKEAIAYCAAGDVFAFASTTETQGLVLAEAKAAGIPVVALFAGGIIDTVRSGIDGYVAPRDIDIFSSHIDRLLKDVPLREKMGKAAREDAEERFSSFKVAKKIETLYNSLVN